MAKRIVILGGGFGGIAAAHRLRALRPDDEVVLVDKGTHFMMGFRKTGVIVGRDTIEDGARPLKALESFGIKVVQGAVTRIDPGARAAEVDGERLEGDALLVALGAETAPGSVAGLAEHGIDWYANDNAERGAAAFSSIEGGTVVVGIFGAPYKCPPAPFEFALLLEQAAREAGKRLRFEIFTPLPSSLPVLGKAGCEAIESRVQGMGIGFRREAKAARVEAGKVVLADGDEVGFDLLFAVPPHRVPSVVVDAGLAEQGGWIKPDPATLRASFEGVWAVGDCTAIPMANGQPMPKSGAFAENAGTVAAEHIAALLAGSSSDARFWGDGTCFLEVGDGEAMVVRGRFLAEGGPDVELTQPSEAFLREKHDFEQQRLAAWFGSP